ncbi:MAG: hypothetical protein GX421_00125 [Caldisericales bacterium]|nr:hypothetical protein [Caldisericales bacterium]
MKRLAAIFLVLVTCFPFASIAAEQVVIETVGNGPTAGEIAVPVAILPLSGGDVAVLDGRTSRINFFGPDGVMKNYYPIDRETVPALPPDMSDSVPFSFAQIKLTSDGKNSLYYIGKDAIYQINVLTGETSRRIGLEKQFIPVSIAIDDQGNILTLDHERCITKYDSSGKEVAKIGEMGKGKGKAINPYSVMVLGDGSIALLDTWNEETSEQVSSDEKGIMIFSGEGKFIREFGQLGLMGGDDSQIQVGFVGFSKGQEIFVLDVGFSGKPAWVIRKYKTSGDFEEKIELRQSDDFVSGYISSFFVDGDGKIALAMPFLSKAVLDANGTSQELGKVLDGTLQNPVSAMKLPQGKTAVLEGLNRKLHIFGPDGTPQKTVTLSGPKSKGPEGDSLGVLSDMAIVQNELLVASGWEILRYDNLTFELKGSYDLQRNVDLPDIIIALASSGNRIAALDRQGQVIFMTGGLPSTFKVEGKPVDVTFDRDGNILLLFPEEKKIKAFSETGAKKFEFALEAVEMPSSICTRPSGEIIITDPAIGQIIEFSENGKNIAAYGKKGWLAQTDTIQDYKKEPDMLAYPSRIRSNQDGTLTVLDIGNSRALNISFREVEPPPPEKKPAKLSVDKVLLDFGKIYYEKPAKTLEIGISNLGEEELEGNVTSSSRMFTVSPEKIDPDTKAIKVTVDPGRDDAWESFKGEIKIQTNGGSANVPVSVQVTGKKVSISLLSTSFLIQTDGDEEKYDAGKTGVIIKGRTLVPLRALGEALGAEVNWNASERKVTYSLDGGTVEIWINKPQAKVNGNQVNIDPPAVILASGSTYVPVRFVAEALGCDVEWIEQKKTAVVYYPKRP